MTALQYVSATLCSLYAQRAVSFSFSFFIVRELCAFDAISFHETPSHYRLQMISCINAWMFIRLQRIAGEKKKKDDEVLVSLNASEALGDAGPFPATLPVTKSSSGDLRRCVYNSVRIRPIPGMFTTSQSFCPATSR